MGLIDPFARDATTASIPHQAIDSRVVGKREVTRFLPVCPRSDRKGAVHRFGYLHRLEMLFGGYFASEYTASLSRKSPESTGPCSTFVELPPRTLRNCEKYAGRPHALKTSGPSINE